MTLPSSKVRGKSIMTAMSNKTCSVAPGVLFPLLCGASSLTSEECFRQGNTNKSTKFSACGGPAFHGSAFHGVFRIAPHEGGERQNTNWNVCALTDGTAQNIHIALNVNQHENPENPAPDGRGRRPCAIKQYMISLADASVEWKYSPQVIS